MFHVKHKTLCFTKKSNPTPSSHTKPQKNSFKQRIQATNAQIYIIKQ